jgi:pimeloyl-ACP methyl ester carboxylesterase
MSALGAGDYDRANRVLLDSPLLAVPAGSRALVETMVNDSSRLWSVSRDQVKRPGRPAIEHLEDVKAPTLVLVGDRDIALSQEEAEVLSRRVSGARLVVIPGGGHLLNLTSPDAFEAATSRFLQ